MKCSAASAASSFPLLVPRPHIAPFWIHSRTLGRTADYQIRDSLDCVLETTLAHLHLASSVLLGGNLVPFCLLTPALTASRLSGPGRLSVRYPLGRYRYPPRHDFTTSPNTL
ncbi:hypothetical protein CMUS01_09281 [Colletotrichum musicola]|uniref:Uncharacterized protein n=1 Tax=Colletotrichum musicola TaxID=2175873 RepID=A0A8H6K9D0_9PEZI|nr:hypothetical protein CMUS01_09281 [Colletotrichum musicola]